MIGPEEFTSRWFNTKLAELDEEHDYVWGTSPLVRYAPAIVERLPISTLDQRFLIQAGLPAFTFNYWRFGNPSNVLPSVTEAFADLHHPTHYDRYRILGTGIMEIERSTSIEEIVLNVVCLDLVHNGRVVVIQSLPDGPVEFLNSSVSHFAEFILLYRGLMEWTLGHKLKLTWETDYDAWHEEGSKYTEDIVKQMLLIDPLAGQPGSGWHGELSLTPESLIPE
jgi:hypothetical protein